MAKIIVNTRPAARELTAEPVANKAAHRRELERAKENYFLLGGNAWRYDMSGAIECYFYETACGRISV